MNTDNLAHDLQMQDDYQTCNYPPEGDTTSEGGYGSPDTFSPPNQRRADKVHEPETTPGSRDSGPSLIDQSLDGGPLASELLDAQQGSDVRSREAFAHAAQRDFDSLNPYGRHPDAEAETGESLASAYADARGRQFESGAAGGNGEDVGAF